MAELKVPFDATVPHTWTAIWSKGETLIGCEGALLRRVLQATDYPLFLVLDLFEMGKPNGSHPKTATLHHFRGWQDD